MSNLSVTTRCNQNCPFCFAGDSRGELGPAVMMARSTFGEALDYLRRSQIRQVRLLGGEPTLHPEFSWMLKTALDQGFDLLIFSNGLIPERVVADLEAVPGDRLCILLNTLDPGWSHPDNRERQRGVMERLRGRIMLGINLYRRGQRLDHLLDCVETFELRREIRLGIAQPLLSGQNRFLHPKLYPEVGRQLVAFHRQALQRDIRLGLDCGFVPCMFPPDSWGALGELMDRAGNCCHPNLDLLPDGRFVSCYPLHDMKQIPLTVTTTADQLVRSFEVERARVRGIGVFPFCSDCPLFGQRCNGGCTAMKLSRLNRGEEPGRELTETTDGVDDSELCRLSA